MQFKLVKKSSNDVLVKYHIVDSAGTIIGQANVPPEQESDLLKCWAGPRASAAPGTAAKQTARNPLVAAFKTRGSGSVAPAAKQSKATAAMSAVSAALLRGPRLSREAILRGC